MVKLVPKNKTGQKIDSEPKPAEALPLKNINEAKPAPIETKEQDDGKHEVSCRLQSRHHEWLINASNRWNYERGVNGANPAAFLEFLVRAAYADDAGKGGTIATDTTISGESLA